MDFKAEQVSPVKTSVEITVPAEEVNAALGESANIYKQRARLDGFRKGKAPIGLVNKLFHEEIHNEARNRIINTNINEILEKLKAAPVSGITLKGAEGAPEKDNEYHFSMEFEQLPDFELPPYVGLNEEETKAEVSLDTVEQMYDRLRRLGSKLTPVESSAPAKDGQVANIDFEVFENGQSISDLKATNYDLEIGEGHSLEALEELVKGIPVGNTAEKEIQFPDDFPDARLAGKTVLMRVTVHAVKERDFSAFDEGMAGKGTEAMSKLRETLGDSYKSHMKEVYSGITQKKLLGQMLKMVDFEIPPSFVEWEQRRILTNMERSLAQEGKSLASLGKTINELLAEVKPEAEETARGQTLLLKIAHAENLSVSDEELFRHIYKLCQETGEDPQSIIRSMRDNGLLYRLRDHLLADKAMDFVYDKANITFVEPQKNDEAENASNVQTTPVDSPLESGSGADEK